MASTNLADYGMPVGDPPRRKPLPGEPGAELDAFGAGAAPSPPAAPSPLAPPPPAAPPAATSIAPSTAWNGGGEMTPQQAAAAGLGWVPSNHSLYGTAGFVGSTASPATGGDVAVGDPQRPNTGVPPPAAPAAPTAPAVTAAPVAVGSATAQGQPTTIAQSFQQALVNKLNPAAVDASHASIAPSINANRLAEQRGVELQNNALAEGAARSGTNLSGGSDALQRGILADSATRQGQFAGNAVQHLQDSQDQQLLAALGLGGNFMQADAARQQQESQFGRSLGEQTAGRVQQGGQFDRSLAESRRTADVDAELRRLGINTQGSLGQGDLALRGRLGDQQGNLGLLGLLMNDSQFGRSLSQNAGQFGASLDQSGLLGMLGLLR